MKTPPMNGQDGIYPPPTPVRMYTPGLFRLPGFGGAAVFLRSGVVPGASPALTVDIGFLTLSDYVWFLRKPMQQGFADDLGGFFFACACDLEPELTLSAVHDPMSGLAVAVLSSTEHQVELEFRMPGDDDEGEGINFLTSRVVLAQAARDVLILESIGGDAADGPLSRDW